MASSKNLSKFLALLLRHHPEAAGLTLDEHGWADVDALIKGVNDTGKYHLDRALLEEIVQTDEKQRYQLDREKNRIRAYQGHSVPVDAELTPAVPPEFLFHGTGEPSVASILRQGLLPMGRLYVHLSKDPTSAQKVGARHGKPHIFRVAAGRMYRQHYAFFLSGNGVWLTKTVPPAFLEENKTPL